MVLWKAHINTVKAMSYLGPHVKFLFKGREIAQLTHFELLLMLRIEWGFASAKKRDQINSELKLITDFAWVLGVAVI